jgi:hypothetical protein
VLSLEKDGVIIEGDENLLNHATEYYSELFGTGDDHNIHIDQNVWEALEVVSIDDNEELCRPFSESEIKDALLQMKGNKATGPDKIHVEFYQKCWHIVKDDIIQLFADFHNDQVNISRINYGIITLLPKVSDVSRIQHFRLICLLNCLYKLITKILTLRLEKLLIN